MMNSMHWCRECGRWFFNWKKLSDHLLQEHGYVIELKEEQDDKGEPIASSD